MNIKKETVKMLVTAMIEYDANDPESRKEAIKKACRNAVGINTYGTPIKVILKTAKEFKQRRMSTNKKV